MCGVAGFFAPSMEETAARAALGDMLGALRHRGPDDEGLWLKDGLAFGHRRLSIVDLSPSGHQPMFTADGRFALIFNGEIYNHHDLRRDLQSLGHQFRGHSDTEVLLALVAHHGVQDALRRCVGMFAFALWDAVSRTLTLCRDRFGEKPLYYGWQNGVLLFASELKAIRRHPAFTPVVDRTSAVEMLRYGFVPGPRSIYQGISKLPPAHFVTIRLNHGASGQQATTMTCYWRQPPAAARAPFRSFEDASLILEQLLRDAVGKQMQADVPLGAFLSGGVDSSLVVALMQDQSSQKIRTFAIGFDDPRFDESEHARRVAAYLATDHQELILRASDIVDVVPNMTAIFDEPFADSSQIPTYLLSKLARQSVTVSLSGDGGDEIFGGYTKYGLGARLKRIPLRRRIGALLKIVPWDYVTTLEEFFRKTPRLTRHRAESLGRFLSADTDLALADELSVVHADAEAFVHDAPSRPPLTGLPASSYLRQAMHLDAARYLPDDVLVKVDRASMAVSLECRAPLLDYRVAELAGQLPDRFLRGGGQSKRILRHVLYRYVPRDIVDRPKQGFSVPLGAWLRTHLRDWAFDLLNPATDRHGIVNLKRCRELMIEHQNGGRDMSGFLWNVLMLQSWLDEAARG